MRDFTQYKGLLSPLWEVNSEVEFERELAAVQQHTALTQLAIEGAMQTLPDSIGRLSNLSTLTLMGCKGLQALPAIGWLTNLRMLNVWECEEVCSLPDSIGNLTMLETLDLWGSEHLRVLPGPFSKLVSLRTLVLQRCWELQTLPESLSRLKNLRMLDLGECELLHALPDALGELPQLESLDLQWCKQLGALPTRVSQLTSLTSLSLNGSEQLYLPMDVLPIVERTGDETAKLMARKRRASFVLSQQETLHQSMGAISWIAVLLAASTFSGFLFAPSGPAVESFSDTEGATPGGGSGVKGALRAYIIADMFTFLIALSTTVYAVSQNMPQVSPVTEHGVLRTIIVSSFLLVFTIIWGVITFIAGALASYPQSKWHDVWLPSIFALLFIVAALAYYAVRIWSLGNALGWRAQPDSHVALEESQTDRLLKEVLFELQEIKGRADGNMGRGSGIPLSGYVAVPIADYLASSLHQTGQVQLPRGTARLVNGPAVTASADTGTGGVVGHVRTLAEGFQAAGPRDGPLETSPLLES